MNQIEHILTEIDRQILKLKNEPPSDFIDGAVTQSQYFKRFINSSSQEPASEDFESEWKRYCDSKGGGAVTINLKDMAHHFARWGAECVKKSQKTLHVAKSCKENGDSLTDEELKIAAGKYAYYEREDDIKGEGGYDLSKLEGFIEGANWQKGQMMKDVVDAYIAINTYPKTWMPELIICNSDDMKDLIERMGLEHEDRVKLVIVKDK